MFSKKGGQKISKDHSMRLIENFQKDNKGHIRSIYYDKEMVQSVLDTKGCVGVSIFFAKDGDGTKLVILPVDENGQQIWDGNSALEVGNPCPPYC